MLLTLLYHRYNKLPMAIQNYVFTLRVLHGSPSVMFQWSLPEINRKGEVLFSSVNYYLIQANNEKIIDTMHHYDQ